MNFWYELPKNLNVVIKNFIVQIGLGNIPPELTSIDLEMEKIPAEYQMKFLKENSETKKFFIKNANI